VRFVCNALSPARVSKVVVDKGAKAMDVIVQDDQLSLAIGRKGQNVRLVAKLTGWKIDVRSENMEPLGSSEEDNPFKAISEVDDELKACLLEGGIETLAKLAEASVEQLIEFEGIDEDLAATLIAKAKQELNG